MWPSNTSIKIHNKMTILLFAILMGSHMGAVFLLSHYYRLQRDVFREKDFISLVDLHSQETMETTMLVQPFNIDQNKYSLKENNNFVDSTSFSEYEKEINMSSFSNTESPNCLETSSLGLENTAFIVEESQMSQSFSNPVMEDVTTTGIVDSETNSFIDNGGNKVLVKKINHEEIKLAILQQLESYKQYPLKARKRGIQGKILLKFAVLPNGMITDVVIEGNGTHPFLVQATQETLRQASPIKLPLQVSEKIVCDAIMEYRLTD